MKRTSMVSVAIACLLASACTASTSGGGTPPPAAASADDTLSIALGERASPTDGSYTVRFVRLVADSRCAANVVCVWQGDAAVRLEITTPRGGAMEATLHTALEPKTLAAQGYTISVLDVAPYPGTSDSTGGARVIVKVARAGAAK